MKNKIDADSPMKRATPTAADLYQVAPSQEFWQTNGTVGHQRDNSQSSATPGQNVTHHDGTTEAQKLLSKEEPTLLKQKINNSNKMTEVSKVDTKQNESQQTETLYKPKELSMVRSLTKEELKDKFNYQKELIVNQDNENTMYWINHLGDKCVTVENQSEEKEDENRGTIFVNTYTFRLYNADFIQIGCFKYSNDHLNQDRFRDGNCTFSPDGRYFGMIFNTHHLCLAYFQNGFEYEMFVEPSLAEEALGKMFKDSNQYVHLNKQLALDQPCTDEEYEAQKPMQGNPEIIKEESFQLRISKTHHIYLFREVELKDKSQSVKKRYNVYKSNMTAEHFISAIHRQRLQLMPGGQHAFKRINMLDYFSKVMILENKLERMYVRGPLAIGFGKSELEVDEEDEDDEDDEEKEAFKIEFFYDYEEDKMVKVDYNKILDAKEMTQLTGDVIFHPSLGQGKVKWYFVAFGFKKIHIFKRQYNEKTKEISLLYRYSLTKPVSDDENELSVLDDVFYPIKIIGMKTIIFTNRELLKYFNIEEIFDEKLDEYQKILVLKRDIICPEGLSYFENQNEKQMIQMHQSSLLTLGKNNICNLSKEPIECYTSRIMIPESIDLNKDFDAEYSFEKKTCSQIIGSNCFEEVLSEWDFRIFIGNMHQSFVKPHLSDYSKSLKFYSKRLNIAIFSHPNDFAQKEAFLELVIVDLRGKNKPIIIQNSMRTPFIRSFKDQNKEIVRVFIVSEASNSIACYTFTNSLETVTEAKITPQTPIYEWVKIYVSQNGQEVSIFGLKTSVLQLDFQNHGEFITKTTQLDIYVPTKDEVFYCENRIMVDKRNIYRISEDYSKIEAKIQYKSSITLKDYKSVFGFQIGDQYFGLFCMFEFNQYFHNVDGIVFVYEIATMMLKTQIENFQMDNFFSEQGQEKLQNFSTIQRDQGIFFFKPKEDIRSNQQYILKLQLYNNELETVCGIPLMMAIRENLIAEVHMNTGLLSYQPMNQENKTHAFSILSTIKLRYYFDPMLDFIDVRKSGPGSLMEIEQKVIQNIQKVSISDLASYNVINRSSYLCNLQRNPMFNRFIQYVLRRLEYLQSLEKMPFILCEDLDGINPLVEALNNENGILAQSILQLCVSNDEAGLLYSQSINTCLQSLIKMGLDLKPYLQSNIPYHQVEEQYNYGTYDTDPTYRISGQNQETLIETLLNKETITVSEKQGLKQKISNFIINPDKQVQRYRIAYSIVNMRELIGGIGSNQDPRHCIKVISDLCKNDISYYDIEVLQAIIKFKWRTYTRNSFLRQFVFLILFLAVYVTDLIFGSKTFGLSLKKQWIGYVATRTICQLILFYFLKFEVKQIARIGFKQYIYSVWNINDVLLQTSFMSYVILSFVAPKELYAIKSLQSYIIYLTFIKIGFYLRIFSELSFLVQMLLNVFYDLRYFLLFFGLVIVSFSLYLGILVNELTDYEGIGPFGFFAIALRTSLGDYDFDSYVKNSDYDILTWIVWFLIMIVGNVIFMNFIIAVVSQSYENCMQTMNAQSYKNKVDLIMEREQLMDQGDLERRDWFPNFIIVRKALGDGVDASQSGDQYGEWQGLLREIQKGVKRQNDTVRDEMKKNNIKLENQILQVTTEIKGMLTKIAKDVNDLQNKKK